MRKKVESIHSRLNDGTKWTVKEMLESIIEKIDDGRIITNKCVLIHLNDDDGESYSFGFGNAGMSYNEMVALLETAKTNFVMDMLATT